MHSLEEAYERHGDLEVFVQENDYHAKTLDSIDKTTFDGDEFVIIYGEYK
jgi:hypothetical protein